jgi:glycosyltransferase involved in cell wall biosynthesis
MTNLSKSLEFSLIIPTRFRATSINKVFEDLQAQDASFEVVLFNDGACPDTQTLCQKEWGFPLTYLESKDHTNSCMSRNACIDKSRGDWLVFLDDDVRIAPKFLLQVKETCKRHAIYSCCVKTPNNPPSTSIFRTWLESSFTGRIYPCLGYFVGGFARKLKKEMNCQHLPGAMMVFKRSLVGPVRFDEWIGEGTGYLDDADFSHSVMKQSRVSGRFVPSFELDHLQAPSGGNRNNDPKRWFYYYQAHKIYYFKKHFGWKYLPALAIGVIETLLRSLKTRTNLLPTYLRACLYGAKQKV